MGEETSPLNFILLITSLFTIALIFNQNESKKDSANQQNPSSSSNPFEKITWIFVLFQFILLLIKVKINNS